MLRHVALVALASLCVAAPAWSAESPNATSGDDYAARLRAGRQAAYERFLIKRNALTDRTRRQVFGATGQGSASTGSSASGATLTVIGGRTDAAPRRTSAVVYTATVAGNVAYADAGPASTRPALSWYPSVFHANWDARYRRSWPRPIYQRQYVPTHWVYDGRQYHYVPGHTQELRDWAIWGRPRFYWNGTHYSISVPFD